MFRGRVTTVVLLLLWLLPVLQAAPHRYRVHPNAAITVLSITQGPDGFLWLAALDGLYRFDGFHYQRIVGYPFTSARRIGSTQDGSVWIGGPQGLVRYFKDQFQVVLRDSVIELAALPNQVLIKVAVLGSRVVHLDGTVSAAPFPMNYYFTTDSIGELWVTSSNQPAAFLVDPNRLERVLETVALPEWFAQGIRDGSGQFWAADASRAIGVKNGRQVAELTRKQSQRASRPNPLFAGRNGQVWFLGETIHGLSPAVEFRDSPVNDQYLPTAGYEDTRGHLWVAKLGLGLIEWIPDPGWQRWSSDSFGGLPAAQVSRGPHGIVAATHNNIYRLEGDVWHPLARQAHNYSAILPLADGGFWATIRELGLARLSPSGEIKEVPANPLPTNDEYRFLIRQGRKTWVGNKFAMFEFAGNPGSVRLHEITLPEIPAGRRVQAIDFELDATGNLWVGYGEGIARLDDQGIWHRIPTDIPIKDVRSFTLAGSRNGDDIWVAFRGDRNFARVEKRGNIWKVTDFLASTGYGPEDSHFVKRDSRGWIWRGSPEGVHVSDGVHVAPNDWLHFSLESGLSTRSTDQFGFFEDADHSIWIAGEDGITRMTPSPSWFGVTGEALPRVTGIEVDGVGIPLSNASSLPQGKQSLRVELGALDLPGTRDNPLRYRVVPQESDWHYSHDGALELASLGPGSYTLEAGLTAGDPSTVQSFPFTIGPAASTGLSWLWILPVPVGGGMLALFGPWFPWSERIRYRLKKDLFLLHRRFTRKDSSSGGPRGPVHNDSGRLLAGRYRLLQAVSRGGFSLVYQAEDLTAPHVKLAVKVLDGASTNESWVRDRFAHEVAALRSVDHRAIVRILDSWISPEGEPCLVMPFLEGPTLREALKHGPLPALRAAMVIRELGAALAEVHGKGLVHRDLKPENVILTLPGGIQPVLIDFGTASLRGRRDELANTTMLSGSFHYMAPERLSGHYSPESDVYSFGVIILEILTGKRLADLRVLFSDDSFRSDLARISTAALPPELALSFASEILKAYDPKPQRRPSDVLHWSESIAQLLERA